MILKTCFLLVLTVAWEVSGASFSKVFVQTGQEGAPQLGYVEYPFGVQSYSYPGAELEQLAVAPFGYEYSPLASRYNYETPCTTSGCFYPAQTLAPLAPVAPNTKIIEYAPSVQNVPVAYAPTPNERPGYEYSYAVVNHQTGDHKVPKELSDGGVVQGTYAFLQPDGQIREVTYIAEDKQGFDAIVKNFLPAEEVKHTETVHHTSPCHEIKSEKLTESHIEHHQPHENQEDPEHQEARHGTHEEKEDPVKEHQEHEELVEAIIVHQEDLDALANPHESHPEHHSEHHSEHPEEHHSDHNEEPTHEHLETPEGHVTHEKLIEIHHAVAHEPNTHEGHDHHTHHSELESHPTPSQEHGAVEGNTFVSYTDIIKCIRAAMTKAHHPSVPRPASPLTYLIYNKPC